VGEDTGGGESLLGVSCLTYCTAVGTRGNIVSNRSPYLAPAPIVSSVTPADGPVAGANTVVVAGAGLTAVTSVAFGSKVSGSFAAIDDNHITAQVPASTGLSPGAVNVVVTTTAGPSATSAKDVYVYVAPPTVTLVAPNTGPTAGGTPVIVTGTNFTGFGGAGGVTAVKFGNLDATTFSVTDATHITATSPPQGPSTVDVRVISSSGTSDVNVASCPARQCDHFVYPQPNSPGPIVLSASSTDQYHLANSDGSTWQEVDSAKLRVSFTPAGTQSTLVSANADLFTGTAGFNQDIGIFVSDNGGSDQMVGWKESGGFAGVNSPNAAYLQVRFDMTSGHAYVFKLKWKTNKNAVGETIYAGAGAGPSPWSPTSLVAKVFPAGAAPNYAASTTQYSLANSDGLNYQAIDAANLVTTLTPTVDSTAVVGANADLFTGTSGYNQDLGIFVTDNGGPGKLLAWKESGGFAGTYSPNAVFVKTVFPMTHGHTYLFALGWKTNKPASGVTIYAGAGPGPSPWSPTTLVAETVAKGANPYTSVSQNQYSLLNSDGVLWAAVDPGLNVTVAPTANTNSIVGANADLFTSTAGASQDLGIFVSDNGNADTLVAWKESGGFAGTLSPNAAFVQATYSMLAGHTYVFKLLWKANTFIDGATIYAGAGPGPFPWSPTRLTVELGN
jgi:hypothetical protein